MVRQNPSPASFIGEGKLAELVQTCVDLDVTTVIFDEELSPAQGRNIQNALGTLNLNPYTLTLNPYP